MLFEFLLSGSGSVLLLWRPLLFAAASPFDVDDTRLRLASPSPPSSSSRSDDEVRWLLLGEDDEDDVPFMVGGGRDADASPCDGEWDALSSCDGAGLSGGGDDGVTPEDDKGDF